MKAIHRQTAIGIVAILVAVFLLLVAIPGYVSSPSNVRNVVLSPLFWPYTLAGLTALIGLGLVITGLWSAEEPASPATVPGARRRLAIMAVIMVLTMLGLPRLGMVWTAMLAFAATAFLVRTEHPATALVCAVMVPLVLYGFFAHVASVAIPQGDFVRLP